MRYLSALLLFVISTLTYAQNVRTYIPPQAVQYFDVVSYESKRLMPELKTPHYFGALIEHESCLSLKHKKCWNPSSELKSAREQGVGLGQVTRAYKADGSLRFDTLEDLRRQHYEELKELSWSNVKQRPDLQIRSMILLVKQNYSNLYPVRNDYQRLAMSDAAYNGGLAGLSKERRACGLAKDCDPQIWFDNVESYCLKSKKALYSGRSACDINRYHTRDVLLVRMPKYQQHIF